MTTANHTPVSFAVSRKDNAILRKIVERTKEMRADLGALTSPDDERKLYMDLVAAHANGCKLRLPELLAASDFDFSPDVAGIQNHINRRTGQIERFWPRYAAQQ